MLHLVIGRMQPQHLELQLEEQTHIPHLDKSSAEAHLAVRVREPQPVRAREAALADALCLAREQGTPGRLPIARAPV